MFYFEHGKNYVFKGEYHNFWEILYVDKGIIEVTTDDACHLLNQGMLIFHKPNEFHRFHAIDGKAPNVIVMTFDCHSEAMNWFYDRIVHLDDKEKNLLADIVREGEQAFEFPFTHPLRRRPDASAGAEQLISRYLEALLIRLYRKIQANYTSERLSGIPKVKYDNEVLERMIRYMEEHVESNFSIDHLSRECYIGKTRLEELFKKMTGSTAKRYFTRMKIEAAKLRMREETDNITGIAHRLGFSSIHAFSRSFKQATGMTPTEYTRSVKAKIQY